MRVRADLAGDRALPGYARRLRVDSASAATLHAALAGPLAWVKSRHVTIDVASWQAPYAQWAGRLGPLPGVLSHEVRLPSPGPGPALVRMALAEPLPFYLVAAAALEALVPAGRLPAPVSPDVAAYGLAPPWLRPSANVAGLVGSEPNQEIIRPYDVVVASKAGLDAGVAGAVEVAETAVLVDATAVNPRGYSPSVVVDTSLSVARDCSVEVLHSFRSVTVDGLTGGAASDAAIDAATDAATEARRIARIAASGVVVLAVDPLPPEVAGLLGDELVGILTEAPPESDGWQERSVRQRRAALRHHATAFALPRLAGMPPELCTPLVSALLVTSRAGLPSALAGLVAQTYPTLEILVALPGVAMSDDIAAVLAQCARPVELVSLPLEQARGSLVTRIDPEASYGPEHVWDLVLARHYSGAEIVGKTCEFFLREGGGTVRRGAVPCEAFVDSLSDGAILTPRDLVPDPAAPVYRTHPFGFALPEARGQGSD